MKQRQLKVHIVCFKCLSESVRKCNKQNHQLLYNYGLAQSWLQSTNNYSWLDNREHY